MGSRVSSFYNNIKSWTVKQLIIQYAEQCGLMADVPLDTKHHQTGQLSSRRVSTIEIVRSSRRWSLVVVVVRQFARTWHECECQVFARAPTLYLYTHLPTLLVFWILVTFDVNWKNKLRQIGMDPENLFIHLAWAPWGKNEKRRKKLWYTNNTSVKYSTSFFFTTTTIRLLVHHSNEQDDWNAAIFL